LRRLRKDVHNEQPVLGKTGESSAETARYGTRSRELRRKRFEEKDTIITI